MFDNRLVKSARLLILMILGLFGLLVLLGSLQYTWLGEISRSERENLQNRLNADIKRFASDFNSELRWAYFSFQIDPADWLNQDWTTFNRRYYDWQFKTSYPDLIKDIYFVGENSAPLQYDNARQTFKRIESNDDLSKIKALYEKNKKLNAVDALVVNTYFLLMPNYASGKETSVDENGIPTITADLSGYVVIKLDEETVKRFLGDLTEKYFPAGDFANYQIIVSDNPDLKPIYSNKNIPPGEWEKNDSNIAILSLSTSSFSIAVNSDVFSPKSKSQKKADTPVSVFPPVKMNKEDSVKIWRDQDEKTKEIRANGNWTLSVRHEQGSLEQFINNTRRKNLAISFSILGLLAASIIFIVISARRAQIFAQRQMDFVSSVSHEFRTPLAVIYSAGENLADEVAVEKTQIARYGNLIKNEGRKLSRMVEQILEFAGARSAHKKYKFVKISVSEVIKKALAECQPIISEENFNIVMDMPENLPQVRGDESALSRVFQNLIINSIKYDGGERHITISARNNDESVKITIEDSGKGIAKSDLKKIFTPFYRAKEVVEAQIHGNGLGLSLVKQIVEAHGGKITVESTIGKGSRFTVHIPLNI